MPTSQVDPLSMIPLFVRPFANENDLRVSASAFIVRREQTSFLITNRHVVTGKDNETHEQTTQSIPDQLRTWSRVGSSAEFGVIYAFNVINSLGTPLWFEHPKYGGKVDVVALPFANIPDYCMPPHLDLSLADEDMLITPSHHVSVIGYPFGKSQEGKLPIWVSGFTATDIDLDWNKLPLVLISSTTKKGMSGSMVISRSINYIKRTTGENLFHGGIIDKFIGVYSGRLKPIIGSNSSDSSLIDGDSNIADTDTNLGLVWKACVVDEIVNHAIDTMRKNNDTRLNPPRLENEQSIRPGFPSYIRSHDDMTLVS